MDSGQINPAYEVAEDTTEDMSSGVAGYKDVLDDEIEDTDSENSEPTLKHARFKITNHSKTNLNVDEEQGVPNGDSHAEADKNTIKDSALLSLPKYLLNRRQSEHSTHHHDGTLGYATAEAVPMSVFYRNENSLSNAADCKQRPTLHELHKGNEEDRRPKVLLDIHLIFCLILAPQSFLSSCYTTADITKLSRSLLLFE